MVVTLKDTIWFSNVTSIGTYYGYGSNNLQEVAFPPNIRSIGPHCAGNCESLEVLVAPEGVDSIAINFGIICKNLALIVLPSSLLSLEGPWYKGTNTSWVYNDVICKAETPPTVSNGGSFGRLMKNFYVPDSSLSAYKDSSPWNTKPLYGKSELPDKWKEYWP